jgi:hypothetical protein
MSFSNLRRIFLSLLVAALLAPVLEAFDDWDSTPGLASDTEFNVAALAVAVGLVAAVALVAARVALRSTRQGRLNPCASQVGIRAALPLPFFPGSSPPPIPLRI